MVEHINAVLFRDLSAAASDALRIAGVPSCLGEHLHADHFVRHMHIWLLGGVETDVVEEVANFCDLLLGEGGFDCVNQGDVKWVEMALLGDVVRYRRVCRSLCGELGTSVSLDLLKPGVPLLYVLLGVLRVIHKL